MTNNFILAVLVSLLSGISLPAKAACTPHSTITKTVQAERAALADQSCSISIRPVNTPHLIYREFIAGDSGLFMVFNSFGDGNQDQFTGAREFYFFPRAQQIDFSVDPRSQDISLRFSNGDEFDFDARTAGLKSMGRGKISVDSKINGANQGGVEISTYKGLWLDLGFAVGHSPSQEPDRTGVFHLLNGTICTAPIKDIFMITDTDSVLRFSDAQLEIYLSQNCPALH
jgi:hypothetical protein